MTIASRWLSSPPAETHDGCPNTEITIIGRIAVPPILAQKCILCVYHPAGFSRKAEASERPPDLSHIHAAPSALSAFNSIPRHQGLGPSG